MAPIKLHGVPFSTCTARVMACLEEKNVQYEICPVDLSTGAHKRPDFISKNPFESRAICSYIAHKYKDQGTDLLQHGNLHGFTKVMVGCEVESQQFNPAMGPIFFHTFIAPMRGWAPDQKAIDENVVKVGAVLDVYEKMLSSSKYLAGDSYTLADLNHLPYITYIMKTPHANLINSRPHVKAWWEAVSSRPASLKVTQEMTLGSKRSLGSVKCLSQNLSRAHLWCDVLNFNKRTGNGICKCVKVVVPILMK
ncbi:glutathione S-transferase F13-like isoform X2 [Papaver somniferum]|uniref:glutathione S-transferase F13-like isoform X2 n=1 Tax=Papaver somniferum TaxID=3469 RepID=UPI000E703E7A|nr:glutathione S-transferase F13-like isoform X2 [Papaver somniferum]